MFIQSQFFGFKAKRQSHELGEVEDGKVELTVHLPLPGIKVHLAEGTRHDNCLGPNGLGVGEDLSAKFQNDLQIGETEGSTATAGLVRPIQGVGSQLPQQSIHIGGIFVVPKSRNLGRPSNNTAIVAGYLQFPKRASNLGAYGFQSHAISNSMQRVFYL